MPAFKTIFAAGLLSGLVSTGSAMAQGMMHEGRDGMGAILASVQLSSAQQQQIHSIMHQAHAQSAPLMQQIRALHEQTEQMLFSAGSVTGAQLEPLVAREESLRQQIDAEHIDTALSVRAVLTSAQLTKAAGTQAQLATLHQQEQTLVHSSDSSSTQ